MINNEPELSSKDRLRKQAHAARRMQKDKAIVSQRILNHFIESAEYQRARWVLWYINVRSEVFTQQAIKTILTSSKNVAEPYCVIPYCSGEELKLFHLESWDEVERGAFSIMEPKAALRSRAEKAIRIEQLDVICLPGVAFDRRGGRLGSGKGYYDRLLHDVRPSTSLIGLAFECQMVDQVPMHSHDVFMNKVMTEEKFYLGKSQSQRST